MGFLDFKPKGDLWTGLAIGAGILAAPLLIPVLASAARPVLKAGIKGGFLLYEKGTEVLANAAEVVEDLTEEVKAEVQAELAQEASVEPTSAD
jgi:hypothetical protein